MIHKGYSAGEIPQSSVAQLLSAPVVCSDAIKVLEHLLIRSSRFDNHEFTLKLINEQDVFINKIGYNIHKIWSVILF